MEIRETLIQKASEARKKAYVPYSRFQVGAAFLTENDTIITGCNIENASYGLSNCAERTAIFKAISSAEKAEEKSFKALAVIADTDRPVPPCGACRQVIAEFCPPTMPVYLTNLKGDVLETTVAELLPGAFLATDLTNE
ncbi:cytidine deaminase [Caldalkalibacillus mannanilyticus]|uniref:cytidine deaminase n=1 Tax=Caldalkalibacillus mannanilyticus TaxID=1418 RepID=UPI0004686E04|nr:cytidine deaminase [Caldalkalibacillus mannanilyticus]